VLAQGMCWLLASSGSWAKGFPEDQGPCWFAAMHMSTALGAVLIRYDRMMLCAPVGIMSLCVTLEYVAKPRHATSRCKTPHAITRPAAHRMPSQEKALEDSPDLATGSEAAAAAEIACATHPREAASRGVGPRRDGAGLRWRDDGRPALSPRAGPRGRAAARQTSLCV